MKKIFIDVDTAIELSKDKNTVILDIPFGKYEYIKKHDNNKRIYEEKHIPGAIKIEMNEVSGEDSQLNIYPAEVIEKVFLSKGIDCHTNLIVYSDGIIAAARIAFIAYWLGVENVKILKGGISEWEEHNLPFETGTNVILPKENFGLNVPYRSEILISTPDDLLAKKNSNPNLVLGSIRSWEEYLGIKTGYPYIKGSGSPLGSVYLRASNSRRDVDDLITDSGVFGNIDEIFAEWKEMGASTENEVTFFCGAGWRAAVAFFLALERGWEEISVFDGGWYQYSLYHEENPQKYPIQIGDPKDSTFKII